MDRKTGLAQEAPAVEAIKILSALERVSQAFRTLLWLEGKALSLNPIQIQVLSYLWKQPPARRRVSAISQAFDLSRASVSDTIKSLEKRGLVSREPHPQDSRSSILSLTASGLDAAFRTSSYAAKVLESLQNLEKEEKDHMYWSLNHLIRDLNASGVITIQRMCLNCHHYEYGDQGHYCHLLGQGLKVSDLKMDCGEHQARKEAPQGPPA